MQVTKLTLRRANALVHLFLPADSGRFDFTHAREFRQGERICISIQ